MAHGESNDHVVDHVAPEG